MKRITLEVNDELHTKVKLYAVGKGQTIAVIVREYLEELVNKKQ